MLLTIDNKSKIKIGREFFLFFYVKNYNNVIENKQKTRREITSTIVVMNGFATTAGSR